MEEFAWILVFVVVWLVSAIGEGRKPKKERRRGNEKRGRSPGRERRPRTGPVVGRRELARDLDEGARRAEQALRGWEARQRTTTRASTGVTEGRLERPRDRWREAGARIAGTAGEAVRHEARDQGREAYAAISDRLAEREIGAQGDLKPPPPPSPVATTPARHLGQQSTDPSALPLAPSAPAGRGRAGRGSRTTSAAESRLSRLDHLPPLQRAILLRELLGPPKALSPGSDLP